MKKIVICGGHLTPALALIEELKNKKDIKVIFFGRKYSTEGAKNLSAEYKLLTKEKIKFYQINAGRLQRRFTKYTIGALLKIPVGFVESFIYLAKERPALIISFGGYLSAPVVLTGWILGIKSIVHEQATVPGLANKINAFFSRKIYLTWEITQKYFPKEKSQVIGNLVRNSIFNKKAKDAKLQKFLTSSNNLIFVMGGNQGSHFINTRILKILPKFTNFNILHQVGSINFQGDLDRAKKINKSNYFSTDYLSPDNIGAALNKADFVIARSGANTVWDLALHAKPAILIPLPIAAANEQVENAKILERAKSAVILNQQDVAPEILLKNIEEFYKNLPIYQKNAEKLSKTLPKNASQILASEIIKLVKPK